MNGLKSLKVIATLNMTVLDGWSRVRECLITNGNIDEMPLMIFRNGTIDESTNVDMGLDL